MGPTSLYSATGTSKYWKQNKTVSLCELQRLESAEAAKKKKIVQVMNTGSNATNENNNPG